MKGRVIKSVRSGFTVLCNGKEYVCPARGKLRADGIFVGDLVEFDEKSGILEKVYERTNLLVRPPLANVTKCIIVMAPVPQPDFLLYDKIIIKCFSNKIHPIICVNKTDIGEEAALLFEKAKQNYSAVTDDILCLSAENGQNIELLRDIIADGNEGITCFAGQSAAGKSSLLNALCPDLNLQTGGLSEKILRGKNTTRHCELFPFDASGFAADTPGFSLLDITDLMYDDLKFYYPEFLENQNDCGVRTCNHILEPNCRVREMAESGAISRERYERYTVLFKELKEFDKRRYK